MAFNNLTRREKIAQTRNAASLVLFVSACAVWITSLCQLGVSRDGIPWYACIGIVAAMSVRFLRVEEPVAALTGLPRSHEPLKLRESLALCFMAIAIALYMGVGYQLLHPQAETPRKTQIVDIQLVSDRDYKNNKDLVPGTQAQEALRERHADNVTRAGNLNVPRVLQDKQERRSEKKNTVTIDEKPHKSNGRAAKVEREDEKPAENASSPAPVEKTFVPSNAVPIPMPSSWQTKTIDPNYVPAASPAGNPQKNRTDQPFISEVAPPELVELMDNDGERDAQHVFQKGGKSKDGKGAENALSVFLKELHIRIKNSWSPPHGETRSVEVLFRVKKDGRLAFLKITRSSGRSETDSSAVKAVTGAATLAHPLPKDYTPNYLDVSYTFKYNVDELQEINGNN